MPRLGDSADSLSYESIQYEVEGWVATIAIDRPSALNSLNLRAFQEIADALRAAAWDDSVAVVVLTGTGDRAFCAGADLKEHRELCKRPRDYHKWISEFIAMQTRLVRLGKPTVARLNGLVLGAGTELSLACDLAVAADDVVIKQVGPERGSVSAIGVTQWLPLVVGDRRAREILLLAEDIPAAKAVDWGLVNQVVPRAELDDAVRSLAERLVSQFGESTRQTLTQTGFWKELVWGVTASHAADWLAIHSGSPETLEGMEAFLETREPRHSDFRIAARDDRWPEFHGGAPILQCQCCGAKHLPAEHLFCGICGTKLDADASAIHGARAAVADAVGEGS